MPGRFQGLQALNGLVRAQRASTAVDTPREVITREGLEQAAREEFARRRKTAGFPTAISLDPDFTGAGQMPRKQAEGAMSTITDFLPPFAEAKDVGRAIEDPSLLNLGVAGLAALGPAGRFLKRGLKSTAKNVVVNKAEREAAAKMSESELQQIVVKKGPVGQELRKVYQGTPHKFAPEPGYPMGRFKDEFIGTGEGAATYGHGHYVAENIDTATAYRDAGSRGKREIVTSPGVESDVVDFLQGALHELRPAFNTPADLATADLKESLVRRLLQEPGLRRVIDAIDKGEASVSAADKGNIYKATLKAADEDFILWDKPLSQQSEKVQEALKPLLDFWREKGASEAALKSWRGEQLYERTSMFGHREGFTGKLKDEVSSNYLKSRGIRGVKYLDEGSRAADKGTHNFVVFDPEDLEILRILGITGAVAGGASQIPQRAQNGPQS